MRVNIRMQDPLDSPVKESWFTQLNPKMQAVAVLYLYVSTDAPYEQKDWLYPAVSNHLPKLPASLLCSHTKLKLYHASATAGRELPKTDPRRRNHFISTTSSLKVAKDFRRDMYDNRGTIYQVKDKDVIACIDVGAVLSEPKVAQFIERGIPKKYQHRAGTAFLARRVRNEKEHIVLFQGGFPFTFVSTED